MPFGVLSFLHEPPGLTIEQTDRHSVRTFDEYELPFDIGLEELHGDWHDLHIRGVDEFGVPLSQLFIEEVPDGHDLIIVAIERPAAETVDIHAALLPLIAKCLALLYKKLLRKSTLLTESKY
jgi:hypothetical protein